MRKTTVEHTSQDLLLGVHAIAGEGQWLILTMTQVSKHYHPPQMPCERLLQAELPENAKIKLRSVASALDPLKLLEEIRAMRPI